MGVWKGYCAWRVKARRRQVEVVCACKNIKRFLTMTTPLAKGGVVVNFSVDVYTYTCSLAFETQCVRRQESR